MDQKIIFNPVFIHRRKEVLFTVECKYIKNYQPIKFCTGNLPLYEDITPFDVSPLKPTRYESISYWDLGDHYDDPLWFYGLLWDELGFDDEPSKYKLQHFMFGNIEIFMSLTKNEVGEPFMKLQGNTTRKVLDKIIEFFIDFVTPVK